MAAFQVFDALAFTGRPDTSSLGMTRNPVVANLWPSGRDLADLTLPSQALTEAAAVNANALAPGPSWLDIEHWPVTGTAQVVAESISKYVQVINWFKAANPAEPIGYYGLPPIRDYWRANGSQGQAGIDAWKAENDALAPITAAVDVLFPSVYTFYDDQPGWVVYAKANIAEARRLAPGKPVYAFLWPQYHESNATLGGTLIAGPYWRAQLDLMKTIADGVVIWGGWQVAWNETSPWWVETKEFLAQLATDSAAASVGKISSVSSGPQKQWWEGEWIIPGVTHYLPERPPEDITPLRPKVERLKRQLAEIPDLSRDVRRHLAGLTRSVTYLERRAATLVAEAQTEAAVEDIAARYRALNAKLQALEQRVRLRTEHSDRLKREDE